jgi:hypothetical protein
MIYTINDFRDLTLDQKRTTIIAIFNKLENHNEHTLLIKENLTNKPDAFDDQLCSDLYHECLKVADDNEEYNREKFHNNFSTCQQRIKTIQQQEQSETNILDIDSLLETID